ncbi:MAG: hypothetical protein M3Z09_04155 [Acidobacteriota bacterium]|nr:hypothetical protein [Acidobacteriota bacterium]
MPEGTKEVTGKVQSFNISPKGMYEGLLLETAKGVVQVNFPPEAGAVISGAVEEGVKIALAVQEEIDERPSDHPVFRLIGINDLKHKSLGLQGEPGPAQVDGVVQRINYARHGEPNGAILETGDFIHLKPEGAKAVDLKIGMKMSVQGETRHSSVPHRVIEAETVNGIQVRQNHDKKGPAHKKHAAKKKHASPRE